MKKEHALKLAEKALNQLTESLKAGHSEQLTQFLRVMARFPKYSLRNLTLIMAQKPDATQVAGFHAWKACGRTVRKGEKGIGIVAPAMSRRSDRKTVANEQDDSSDQSCFHFRVVHVFDVAQTEGADLPELTEPDGDVGPRLEILEDVVKRFGIELEYAELPFGTQGTSHGGRIVIDQDLPSPVACSVLVHELSHELMHRNSDRPRPPKHVRETEAEAVAMVVCHAFGLDCTTASADYIQLQHGDAITLTESLQLIQKVAVEIIHQMHRSESTYYAREASFAAA